MLPMGSKRRVRNVAGPEIAKARIAAGLTQEQLAARLQVLGLALDRGSVAKIESRIRSVFDYELIAIGSALETPVADLCPRIKEVDRLLKREG